ncbi:MAG: hypothetical protein ACM3VS_11925 [Candidatus Dadabacteria bacterium]
MENCSLADRMDRVYEKVYNLVYVPVNISKQYRNNSKDNENMNQNKSTIAPTNPILLCYLFDSSFVLLKKHCQS